MQGRLSPSPPLPTFLDTYKSPEDLSFLQIVATMYIPANFATKTEPLRQPEPEEREKSLGNLIISFMPTRLDNNDCRTVPKAACKAGEVAQPTGRVTEDMRANGDINLGMRGGMRPEDIMGIFVIIIIVFVGVGIWLAFGNVKGPRNKIRSWYRQLKNKIEVWKNGGEEKTLAGSASPPDLNVSPISSAVTLTDKDDSDLGHAFVGNMHRGRAPSPAGSSSTLSSSSPPSPLMLSPVPQVSPRTMDSLSPNLVPSRFPRQESRRDESSLRNPPTGLALRQQEG